MRSELLNFIELHHISTENERLQTSVASNDCKTWTSLYTTMRCVLTLSPKLLKGKRISTVPRRNIFSLKSFSLLAITLGWAHDIGEHVWIKFGSKYFSRVLHKILSCIMFLLKHFLMYKNFLLLQFSVIIFTCTKMWILCYFSVLPFSYSQLLRVWRQ